MLMRRSGGHDHILPVDTIHATISKQSDRQFSCAKGRLGPCIAHLFCVSLRKRCKQQHRSSLTGGEADQSLPKYQ